MMIKHCSIMAAVVLAMASSASGQLITYVDATDGANGNTRLTNGTTWSPQTANQGTSGDGLWARRAFANNATIYQNAANANTDNAHRIVTTVTNLAPNKYLVYAYMWRDVTPAGWRMEAALTNNPGGELPLYITDDPGLTQFYNGGDPANPLYSTNLAANPFTTPVMVAEGNRRLIQIPLGEVTVAGNSFQVFIDDYNAMTDSNQRTWYDGVGYVLASGGQVSVPILLSNGDLTISFIGTAGRRYAKEVSTNLAPPITWMAVLTNTADLSGNVSFTNTPADSQEFYRVRDVTLPAQVTNLTATAGNAQVSLNWSAASFATSYNVKRATTGGGPYTTITNVTTTSFVNTGLANGTTYYYVVSALNANGESADSSPANATPMPPPPPAAPTGLAATAGNAVVLLSWTASSGATSYNVKGATVSGGPYATVTNVTTTSFIITDLTNGTTYYFVVSALNANGESTNSLEVSAMPEALPPAAPTGLLATAGNAQVTLSWSASLGATSYDVKRATNSGGPYTRITLITATSLVSTGLVNGTTYYYVVSALNDDGESADSSEASATPTQQIPLVYAVENTGAGFPPPPLPTMANTPIVQPLPDPFMWSATDPYNWTYPTGRSTNFSDWSHRRSQIKAEIENYEIGPKPYVDPTNIFASISGSGTTRTLTVRTTNVVNGVVRTLTQTATITLPASSGTFPAMIGFNGSPGLLGGRAIAAINYQVGQISTYGSQSDTHPYYQLYAAPYSPTINSTTTGQYSAWAWGCSRLIDGLYKLNGDLGGGVTINLERIGVTGCSYAGKGALFCGAFDERIVLTIPQESGGGGAPNWRYSATEPSGTVEWIPNTDHNWFSESMFAYGTVANVSRLPHDHHELLAMVAPRALFANANPSGAVWLSNPSAYVSFKAVKRIYDQFGISDRFGYLLNNGGQGHCATPTVLTTNVNLFLDKFLLGLTNTVTTGIEIGTNDLTYISVDTARWTDWWGTTNPVFTGGAAATYTNTYEPECATVGTNWVTISDAAASNGKYVTLDPNLPQGDLGTAPTDSAAHIVIPFSVPTNGNTAIFARVNCPTADDDSFWVQVDGGSFTMLNGLSGGANWIWVSFGTFNLTAGAHTLTIAHRENGALLDKILISDYQFAPSGMGPPAAILCP